MVLLLTSCDGCAERKLARGHRLDGDEFFCRASWKLILAVNVIDSGERCGGSGNKVPGLKKIDKRRTASVITSCLNLGLQYS